MTIIEERRGGGREQGGLIDLLRQTHGPARFMETFQGQVE
jgi:hypothetical protein